jgi:putative peptide zinc metalloprotease protein
MAASLFTLALNLNPVAKFDGYYLAVAATGINNLRGRAFGLYINFFTGKPIREPQKDLWILALYAPFSLLYIWFVFGFLFWRIFTWSWTQMPITVLFLLAIWAVYYFCPRD